MKKNGYMRVFTKHVYFLIATILLLFFFIFNSCKKVHDKNSTQIPHVPVDSVKIPKDTIGTINVTARLLDSLGKPLANVVYLMISSTTSPNQTTSGSTDSSGNIKNIIAKSANYILYVYASDYCGPLYSQAFITLNTDISLGNIVVPIMTFMVTGTVIDCNNNVVNTGKVFLQFLHKDSSSSINADGTFNFVLPSCNKTDSIPVILWAADANGLQTGNRLYFSLHLGNNDVGKIFGCYIDSGTNEFMKYSVDSTHYSFVSPADPFSESVDPATHWMFIGGGNLNSGTAPGVYFALTGNVGVGSTDVSIDEFNIFPDYGRHVTNSTPQPIVNITEYGPIGGYIAGNITKIKIEDLKDQSVHDATCSFRIKRTE